MKNLVFVSVAIIVVSYCSNALCGLRTDTFDNDSNWEAISGKYEIKGGELFFEAPPTQGPLMGFVLLKEKEGIDTKDIDYIEVRGMDLNGPGAKNIAIFFGYDKDAGSAYFAGPFVGGVQKWIFAKMTIPDHNWINGRGTSIADAPDKLGPDIWYKTRLEFKADSVTLYGAENGKPLKELVTLDFPEGKPKGRIGLGGCDCVNKFDDFTVSGVKILAIQSLTKDIATTWGAIRNLYTSR
jgi:hypothetical protein